MNYRHSYHAGNFADLFKHLILTLLIGHFNRKDSGWSYLDTHAGRGLYELDCSEKSKSSEAAEGIKKIWPDLSTIPEASVSYCQVLQQYNPDGILRIYPGSLAIVKALARPQDRLIGIELHPEEQRILKVLFRHDAQVSVHLRDGYESLKAFLPPKPARGLVLIDPPFEMADEFSKIFAAVKMALLRWPTGCYVIWYPIKNYSKVEHWITKMKELANNLLRVELSLVDRLEEDAPLAATGILIFNPPWQIEGQINDGIAWLWSCLSPLKHGGFIIERF